MGRVHEETTSGHQPTSLQIYKSFVSSLLGSTVKHHLESIGTPVIEQVVHVIYVNNLIGGVNTTGKATQFYKVIMQYLKRSQ